MAELKFEITFAASRMPLSDNDDLRPDGMSKIAWSALKVSVGAGAAAEAVAICQHIRPGVENSCLGNVIHDACLRIALKKFVGRSILSLDARAEFYAGVADQIEELSSETRHSVGAARRAHKTAAAMSAGADGVAEVMAILSKNMAVGDPE